MNQSKVTRYVEPLAEQLYIQYCAEVGGKAFNGDPLPSWNEFRADPSKTKQFKAWIRAADTAMVTMGVFLVSLTGREFGVEGYHITPYDEEGGEP